jgi:putative ABC transport system permease protein
MTLKASAELAARYLARHRIQTLLLASTLALVLALPVAVRLLVRAAEKEMRARAADTPLILGTKGSAVDLMLASLYFRRQTVEPLTIGQISELRASGLADAIPLQIRFHAQSAPIVGTEMEYFSYRHLRLSAGRLFVRLGDCVVGAAVAKERNLKVGEHLFSSPESTFDIAGVYPLKMRITGVLAPAGTVDDQAIFVDVKTTWLIDGRAHGHDDLTPATGKDLVLLQEEGNVVGNAAVKMYNEVTDKNFDGFHFHGDETTFPVTAAVVLPHGDKESALLEGRYMRRADGIRLVRPAQELDTLLGTLFRLESLAVAGLALTGGCALAVGSIVFALSFRMRQREFQTLADIGISASSLRAVRVFEVFLVGAGGLLLAGLLIGGLQWLAPTLVRWTLM